MTLINKYCVYAHVDKNGHTFYIGSGTLSRAYNCNPRNEIWEEYVQNQEYEVYLLYKSDNRKLINRIEEQLIDMYKSYNMCNCNKKAGFRTEHSDETKKKMSLARIEFKSKMHPRWKGYVFTPKGQFDTTHEAAIANNISPTTVHRRCHDNKYPKWYRRKQ